MRVLYDPNSNFTFPGLKRFHPANLRKYEDAARYLPSSIETTRSRAHDYRAMLANRNTNDPTNRTNKNGSRLTLNSAGDLATTLRLQTEQTIFLTDLVSA